MPEARRADGGPVSRGATLERELGLLDATGIGVGAIVGAGIFVVFGVAAGVADAAVLVGILLAGLALALALPLTTIIVGLATLGVGLLPRALARARWRMD